MKKIMVAAVAAVVVGAAFADVDCNDSKNVCAYAYRVKLAGKTVKAKAKIDAKGECVDGATNCWAKAASLRIAGYLYSEGTPDDPSTTQDDCNCSCIDFASPTQIWWDETKTKVDGELTLALYEVLRNSGLKNKAQLAFEFDLGGPIKVNLAGFGVFNPNTRRLKRASGFFAGTMAPVNCMHCDEVIGAAEIFEPCLDPDGKEVQRASAGSIAYGRWNMAWKHEKVALLSAGKAALTPGVLIPHAFVDPSTQTNP